MGVQCACIEKYSWLNEFKIETMLDEFTLCNTQLIIFVFELNKLVPLDKFYDDVDDIDSRDGRKNVMKVIIVECKGEKNIYNNKNIK